MACIEFLRELAISTGHLDKGDEKDGRDMTQIIADRTAATMRSSFNQLEKNDAAVTDRIRGQYMDEIDKLRRISGR